MKQMRTALVRSEEGNLHVKRYGDYNTQNEFATDLRGNGFRVLKIWNGYISDAEVDDWEYLNRNPREFKATKTNTTDKPYIVAFYTFDGSEDDVTASIETDFQDYATFEEAYKSGQEFKKNCPGHLLAGYCIEGEDGEPVYEIDSKGKELFYVDGNEVDFDTFNAKYNVHTYYFNKELDELFDKFENASETIYKADYLNNDKARIAAINERANIRDEIFNAAKNYEERYNGEIGGEMQLRIENAEEGFEDWKTKHETFKKMDAEGASPAEKVAALRTIDAEKIAKTNETEENESMETAYTVYVNHIDADDEPTFAGKYTTIEDATTKAYTLAGYYGAEFASADIIENSTGEIVKTFTYEQIINNERKANVATLDKLVTNLKSLKTDCQRWATGNTEADYENYSKYVDFERYHDPSYDVGEAILRIDKTIEQIEDFKSAVPVSDGKVIKVKSRPDNYILHFADCNPSLVKLTKTDKPSVFVYDDGATAYDYNVYEIDFDYAEKLAKELAESVEIFVPDFVKNVKLQNVNNKPVFTKVDYANNLANAVSNSNSKRRRWDVYTIKNAVNLKGFDDVRDAAQKVLDEGFDSFTVGDYLKLIA